MEYLTELSRLPQKEIKEKLDKNNYVGPGSLVVYKEKVHKVLARIENHIFLNNIDSLSPYMRVYIGDLIPLSYSAYRDTVTKKYREGSVFKSLESLCSYLKKTLNKVYGEDRIDVTTWMGHAVVKIYFPEIVVKNSLGLEHTMTDVYLSIYLRYHPYTRAVTYYSSKLWRETYTPEEVNANYMFSHVSTDSGRIADDWCYGNTDFNDYLKTCILAFNPKDIVFFIEQTKSYMQWESIEGTPYRYIANIKSYKVKTKDLNIPNHQMDDLYNKVCENLDSFNYELDSVSDNFYVRVNIPQLQTIIDRYVSEEFKTRNVGELSGDVELLNTENISLMYKSQFVFKGRELEPRIVPSNKAFDISKLDEIYPKETPQRIINEIKERLQNKFKEHLIKYKLEND